MWLSVVSRRRSRTLCRLDGDVPQANPARQPRVRADQHKGAAGAPRRRPVEPRPRPPASPVRRTPAASSASGRRGEEVAKLTYFGLYALQHRGQEAAGIAVSDGSGVVVYKDLGLVAQVFDEPTLASLRGHIAIGHTRYSTTGALDLGERPADAPRDPTGRTAGTTHRARPQRQPGQHRRAGHAGRPSSGVADERHLRHRPGDRAARRPARPVGRGGRAGGAADAARRVQLRLHGRGHALRRPRRPGRAPAGARPAGARLGGRQRDRRAGHRRRERRPRGRARRADRDRRGRPALDPVRRTRSRRAACSSTSTSPGRTPRSPAATSTPPGSRSAARWPGAPGRGRPGHPGAGVRHPGRDRLRRGSPASRTAPGLVKNAYVGRTFIQPSPDASASSASGSSSTRCATSCAASGSSWSTTRSCAATPSGRMVRMLREAGRARGARADLLAAGEVAVLLRHRLRHPGRADRQRARHRGHPALDRRRLARLRLARRPDRRDRAAEDPAVPGLLRRRVPDRAAGRRPDRQARARGRAAGGSRRRAATRSDASSTASRQPRRPDALHRRTHVRRPQPTASAVDALRPTRQPRARQGENRDARDRAQRRSGRRRRRQPTGSRGRPAPAERRKRTVTYADAGVSIHAGERGGRAAQVEGAADAGGPR